MSTSGVSTLSMTAGEIIRDAFGYLGIYAPNEAINADDESTALRELNKLVARYMTHGLHVWSQDTQYVTLVAGTDSYEVGTFTGPTVTIARPVRLLSVWLRDSNGYDTDLLESIGRDDYELLTNKSVAGTPDRYWYKRLYDSGYITLYPVPDATVIATYPTLYFTQQRALQTFSSVTNDADFPMEWADALSFGLAEKLSPIYPETFSRLQVISALSAKYLGDAINFDREDASTFFGVSV